MSLDLQTIGVAFDTSGLEKGAAALGRTAQAAGSAADAADRASGAMGRQGAAAGRGAEGMRKYSDTLGGLGGATDAATQKTLAFIASLERQVATFGKTSTEVQRYDAELLKMTASQRRHTDELLKAQVAQDKAAKSTGLLGGALKLVGAAWAGIRLVDFARDALMLAARYETLGVVMRVAGNNAGYTREQMEGYAQTLQKTGISMIESRNATIQLATANIDLSKAQGLARAAQDLAVVGQTNSSEALARLIHGIKSGQVEILRTLGLNVNFEASYKKLADALGISTEALDENQKMMARTNAVMEESGRYAGIYEEAMTTVGKAITSLTRYVDDLRVKMGGTLLPSLAISVNLVTRAIQAASQAMGESAGSAATFARGLDTVLSGALKSVAVGAHAAYTAYKMLTIQIGAGLAAVEAFVRGDLARARAIGEEARKQTAAAEAANRAFIDQVVRGQQQVQSGQTQGLKLTEAEVIARANAARTEAAAADKLAAQKRHLQDFNKTFATDAQKAALAVDEWRAKLGTLFTPEMEKKIREGFGFGSGGGKGAADATRQANALIEEALAVRVQKAKDAADAEQRAARQTVLTITHLRRMGALEEVEAIERVAAAEIKALEAAEQAARTRADLEAQRPKNKKGAGGDNAAVLAAQAEVLRAHEAVVARQKELERDLAQATYEAAHEAMLAKRKALMAQVDAYQAVGQQLKSYNAELQDANALAQLELSLMGKSDDERTAALITRRAELALAKQLRDIEGNGLLDPVSKKSLTEQARANALLAQSTAEIDTQVRLLKELDASLDPNKAQSFGEALRGAFAGAGDAMVALINSLDAYASKQEDIASDQAKINRLDDPNSKAKEQLKLAEKIARVQVQSYGDMAAAAKGFFKEGTTGYKALEAAEKAFRLYELSSRALAFATKMGWVTKEVTVSVAADQAMAASAVTGAGTEVAAKMTVAHANAVAGVANQANGDPYSAFARMAAMAAIMAAMGLAVRGGGGSRASESVSQVRQAAQGTGTVLGDDSAKSRSIVDSLELLAGNSNIALKFNSEMLAALRSIDNGVAAMTGSVARSTGLRGTPLDALNAGVGSSKGFLGFNKRSTSLLDQGLYVPAQSVGAIVAGGMAAYKYTMTETKKSSFWGLFSSTRRNTSYEGLDAEVSALFSSTVASLAKGVELAAKAFGASGQTLLDQINAFTLNIGTISLNGLSAQEIEAELGAVFSQLGDQMARALIPGLDRFQQVGEGYFQTAIRVAAATEDAQFQLERFGITAVSYTQVAQTQGDLGAEIVRTSILAVEQAGSGIGQLVATLSGTAEDIANTYGALRDLRDTLAAVGISSQALTRDLVRGGRGVEELQSSMDAYFENFFTDAERAAAQTTRLRAEFAQLGLAMPANRQGFRALVEGIDETSASGQMLLGQVLALAEAFAEMTAQAGAAADTITPALDAERTRLRIERERASGNEDGARWMQRQADTEGYTSAQKALYDYNQSLRDQITILNQRAELDKRMAELTGGVAAVRALELSRMAAVLRPMQQLVWQREDEAKRLVERQALEKRLLQAQGNTAELRRGELAAMDASLRTLQKQIWATEDANALTTQRTALERRVLELQGHTTEIRRRELLALDASLHALQRQVWALEDQARALEERAGLERRLLELQGDTAAIRLLERNALQAGNRALFDRIMALQDEQERLRVLAEKRQEAADALEQAFRSESDALQTKIDDLQASAEGLREFSRSLREFRDSLTLGALSPLTPGQKYASALAQFESTYALALGGDQDAMGRMQQVANDLLTASQRYLASSPAYQADFAKVQAALTLVATSADGQASAAEQQIALAQAQLVQLEATVGALITLEQAVLSVAEAIVELAKYPAIGASAGSGLPAYAEGTDFVPSTGPALLHRGEAVLPRGVVAQVAGMAASGPALEARLDAIAQEVRQLAEQSAVQTRALIQTNYDANQRAANQIVDGSGRSRFELSQAQRAKEMT